jgi:hypothetical protein
MDIRAELPNLLPLAIAWAQDEETKGLVEGTPLSLAGTSLAKSAGVAHPEKVRVVQVEKLPYPDHPLLREAAEQTGMLGPDTAGLTLGYAVFMLADKSDFRLLSHELRHVYQYESNGAIPGFLPHYLRQVIEVGYDEAPFEKDAREHERLF